MHVDQPPALCDRFMRCVGKAIYWRAASIREPRQPMTAALAAYWQRQTERANNAK